MSEVLFARLDEVVTSASLGTGVAAALAKSIGSAGAVVLFNGAGGTPTSLVLSNATGLPTTALLGVLQAAQEPAHSGDVTNSTGSLALAIGATKVTSAMLNTDVFSTAHSWSGVQTLATPIINGTISGTTVIPVANGGTGLSSYTIGDLLYASGAAALSTLADVAIGQPLISGGVGVAPGYAGSWVKFDTSGTLLTVSRNATAWTPAGTTGLHVAGGNTGEARIQVTAANSDGVLVVGRMDGTFAAPTHLLANEQIMGLVGVGIDTDGSTTMQQGGAIGGYTGSVWTSTNHSFYWDIFTIPNGSTTFNAASRFGMSGGLSVGAATDMPTGVISAAVGFRGGTYTGTSTSTTAMTVGRQGATNPAFQVDSAAASGVTGLKVQALTAGNGVGLTAISSATDEQLFIDAKGAGTINIGVASSTGAVNISRTGVATNILGILGVVNASPKTLIDVNANTSTSPALIVSTSLTRYQAADAAAGGSEWVSYGAAPQNILSGGIAGGTAAVPTVTPGTKNMFNLRGYGYTGSAWAVGALITIRTAGIWSGTSQGSAVDFYTTPDSSTSIAQAGTFNPKGGLSIGAVVDVGSATLLLNPQTFATLPAAAAGNKGAIASVTDSTTVVWGATITGGGANPVMAFSNGTNWTVFAK